MQMDDEQWSDVALQRTRRRQMIKIHDTNDEEQYVNLDIAGKDSGCANSSAYITLRWWD